MTSSSGGPSEQSTKVDAGESGVGVGDIEGAPKEGDIIAGKYRVESVLGKGGMGVVVAARHTSLRQDVAVKFLLPKALRLPEAKERFLREARAAVSIKSEHVARVLDVGELENGAPYMVMEHLSGTDFAKTLRARGPIPSKEAVDAILQACEAIAEAHALGIVHRDLKPGNLFLTTRADGSALVKVLDFGLSKSTRSDEEGTPEQSLTVTGVVVGSPHYMSPEQLRSLKLVDTRTDIWALGVILYQLLSCRRPFEGDSMVATCARIAADAPTPLREQSPDVPAGLEAVILRCLEKDRDQRLQSVAELARALEPFGSERAPLSVERIVGVLEAGEAAAGAAGGSLAPPRGRISGSGAQSAMAASRPSHTSEQPKRNLSTILGAGMGGLALLIAIATVIGSRMSSGAGTETVVVTAPVVTVTAAASASVTASASASASATATATATAAASDTATAGDTAAASDTASDAAADAGPAAVAGKPRASSAPTTSAAPTAAAATAIPSASAKVNDSMLDQWK